MFVRQGRRIEYKNNSNNRDNCNLNREENLIVLNKILTTTNL